MDIFVHQDKLLNTLVHDFRIRHVILVQIITRTTRVDTFMVFEVVESISTEVYERALQQKDEKTITIKPLSALTILEKVSPAFSVESTHTTPFTAEN